MTNSEPYQLNKETLEALIQTYSQREIARMYGLSCISYWLKKWDIQVPESRKHEIHPQIDLDILKQEAKLGTYAKDIAKKYGWDLDSIFWQYRKHKITPTKPNDHLREVTLTSEQKQLVIGSLLGDGSIRPSGMFVMSQGHAQLEYLNWKRELMTPLMSRVTNRDSIDERSGRLDKGHQTYSPIHPYFQEMRKIFYPNGKKIFPNLEKLSPLALAVWYMDDGTTNVIRGFSYLCTQSFTEVENHKISYFFLKYYGIETKVYPKEGKFLIGMNRVASSKFFNLVQPYIHPTMLYKIQQK